jgi:molybdopterin/thiamine biosynthesis adenylyltransferase
MQEPPAIFKSKPKVPRGTEFRDVMESALTELYFIEYPTIPKGTHDPKEVEKFVRNHKDKGVWVYYPWRKVAMHIPSEKTYQRLRTARNRNLIYPNEQEKYRDATVGITGLSIGSTAFATLVATGGAKYVRLADPDILEITNLNRIRATLLDVGENKTELAARAAWELDPFLKLQLWPQGVSHVSMEKFIRGLDVCIDEMDNIELKILCRVVCKKLRVPVVMATDNGDSTILDVERFDLEPKRPIFHGRVKITPEEVRIMTRAQFIKLSNAIIDPKVFTQRQQESLMEIGTTLSGVAQLGSAASLAGVAIAYATRRITTGQDMPSGRYIMSCEESIIKNYNSPREQASRAAHTKKFIAHFTRA